MTSHAESSLKRATRAFDAARALFRAGLVAESHPFMVEALRAALDAWHKDGGEPDDASALRALGDAGYPDVDQLRAGLTAASGPMPADVEWLWAEAERLYVFSRKRLLRPNWKRKRWLALGLVTALGIVLAVSWRTWGRMRIRASATLGTEYPASNVLDGNDTTEWLAPEAKDAWLEIRPPRPRRVQSVRVYNGHNRFYMDRALRRFRVTLFAGDKQVASAEKEFTRLTDRTSLLDVEVAGTGVTLVRLDALSHFGAGVAIGDVEIR
jgi:hypothetical protein